MITKTIIHTKEELKNFANEIIANAIINNYQIINNINKRYIVVKVLNNYNDGMYECTEYCIWYQENFDYTLSVKNIICKYVNTCYGDCIKNCIEYCIKE